MKTKICNKCKVEKELNEINFNISKTTKWWFRWTCKICKHKIYEFRKTLTKSQINKYIRLRKIVNGIKSRLNFIKYKKSERHKFIKLNDKHKRRQYMRTSDGSVTQTALDDLLLRQSCLCNVCENNISNRSDRHLDHIYPLSRWWLHTLINLQWLCVTCNLKKWNRLL